MSFVLKLSGYDKAQANSKQPTIGKLTDDAMVVIVKKPGGLGLWEKICY